MNRSSHSVHRDLAWALKQQATRAGEQAPSVRGADWRLATVTAVGTGTVTADGLTVRCMESYLFPAAGDVIVITQSSSGNWLAWGRTAANADPVGQRRSARRTTDLTRTNTNVLAADTQLTFPVQANAVYLLDGWIKYSANTGTADLQLSFSAPDGSLGEWMGHGAGTAVVSYSGSAIVEDSQQARGYMTRTESNDVESARAFGGLGAAIPLTVLVYGTLRTAGTAGDYTLLWAQNTANATGTTLYADSWLRLERVA